MANTSEMGANVDALHACRLRGAGVEGVHVEAYILTTRLEFSGKVYGFKGAVLMATRRVHVPR